MMKKTYAIEVDCANCAAKMEEATNKVPGVAEAAVSFMTQKMKVAFEEGAETQGHHGRSPEGVQESGTGLRDFLLIP